MKPRIRILKQRIVALLSQGITPHKIALSLSLGIVLGLIPLPGSSTILCIVVAVMFGINLPLIQVVNYLVYPLQLLLLIPFIQLGQALFGQSPLPLSAGQLMAFLHMHLWHSLGMLWAYTLHALVAWLLLGGIAGSVIYLVLRPILKLLVLRNKAVESSGVD